MTQVATATASNSAIPAGLRRRSAQDSDIKAAKGHAAGVLFVAPDGDVLLLRRGGTPGVDNFVGHFALPGGGVEDGETPELGADREVREEMGVQPEGKKKLLDQRITPNGMAFHTFAQPVAEKFIPKLNDEHTGYVWASLDMLPQPLHPAVAQTLKDRLGMAEDMKPDDWAGLRAGFLKWTQEEEAEPKHAADDAGSDRWWEDIDKWRDRALSMRSNEELVNAINLFRSPPPGETGAFGGAGGAEDQALTIALDRDSVREFDKDGKLHIKIAHISKAMVCPYKGSEIPGAKALGLDQNKIYMLLRDPEELRKAAPTFNNLPLLDKHVPVTATNYDAKIKPHIVGSTGTDAKFDGGFLDNSLVIWSGGSIAAVESEEQRELSCGYHYRAEMTSGNFDGTPFDGVMRDIVGNHITLVKDGRAGPDVVVGDSTENLMSKTTRLAALALSMTAATVAPLLAMDSKVTLPKGLFNEFTTKNFADSKAKLLAGARIALDGKLRKGLAMDATMEGLAKAIDTFAGMPEAMDEPLEENAMKKMQSDAEIEPVKEEVEKKAFDAEPIKAFLKEKGMAEDDIKAVCDMMGGMGEAEDEDKDGEKAKLAEAAKKAEDEAKTAKDAMKDMVSKPAMDAAIKLAQDAAIKTSRETERGIRQALAEVRPYVGELPETMAFDSGADVIRHALTMLEVDGAKTLHIDALRPVLAAQRKAGAQAIEGGTPHIAMDAASTKSFNDRFAGAGRIQHA